MIRMAKKLRVMAIGSASGHRKWVLAHGIAGWLHYIMIPFGNVWVFLLIKIFLNF